MARQQARIRTVQGVAAGISAGVVSLAVVRAHGATTSGSRSVKMRRAQEGTLQKNLRIQRISLTGWPAHGRSVGVRW